MKVGDIYKTKSSGDVEILSIVSYSKVLIRFITTGFTTYAIKGNIEKGSLKDPKMPRVFGVGYLDVGEFAAWESKKNTWEYNKWFNMLGRCYNENNPRRYIDVEVEEYFHSFQRFSNWATEQVGYKLEGYELDKDILSGESKIYSRSTCVFIPYWLNSMLTNSKAARSDTPCGVFYREKTERYLAYCNKGDGTKLHLGSFGTREDAFDAYKNFKESLIKEAANKLVGSVDDRVIEALYNYKINITD